MYHLYNGPVCVGWNHIGCMYFLKVFLNVVKSMKGWFLYHHPFVDVFWPNP